MGKTLQIVASLISTVAFTAVFQVPGGYNSDPSSKAYGKPLLIDNLDFKSFIRNDMAALSLSLITLMVMFLAPVAGDYFYSSFLKMGTFLICFAILFTAVAFYIVATLFLLRHSRIESVKNLSLLLPVTLL
ncbi:uncharacterized protein LOC122061298 [Macadamia integrifolia]|uniref:uncharacterized protein LOC122061298 n=1 Tax=Macadamia integrifolia TaxID=60698 RepID=UPI001C4E7E75|nr:uncharacterized protein LOC122061298 [Macadamia integrifolia]